MYCRKPILVISQRKIIMCTILNVQSENLFIESPIKTYDSDHFYHPRYLDFAAGPFCSFFSAATLPLAHLAEMSANWQQ